MRGGRLVVGAAMAVALGVAGCGSDPDPGSGASARETTAAATGVTAGDGGATIDVDDLDACAVITDAQVKAFFGEPGGEKSRLDQPYAASCSYDDASGDSYLSLVVQAPPDGAKKQFDYDKASSRNVKPISGLGDEGYSWQNSGEAGLEIVYRGALVILSQQPYRSKIEDPEAVIAKLTELAGPTLKQIPN